jgi:CBS domain containing-hemolysin-like protein
MNTVFGLIAIVVLVALNGFFVAAEFSLVGSRRTRLAQLAKEGHSGAIAAEYATEHLDSYIAATQLGITLASLGLGWIGEPAISHAIEPILAAILPHEMIETVVPAVGIAVGFSIVTILHIVMGELVPKSIALQRPESTSIFVARPTALFLSIFRPIIWLMNSVGNSIVRMLGFDPIDGHAQVHSAEELEMLVHSSREAGLLQANEELLLRRVFDFSDLHVREIMQPRVDVDALPIDTSFQQLLQHIATQKHTRYPIYNEDIDHVAGILHVKDLFNLLFSNPQLLAGDDTAFDFAHLLRDPLFVPGTLSVDQLLEQMQKTQTQFAVVIDEYGGTAGVATMEDIVEELVGEVQDEFDNENESIIEQGNVTILDGLVSMTDVISRFADDDIKHESATIGGYIAETLNKIPMVGDFIQLGKYEFRVLAMDGLRVELVEVVAESAENID